MKQYDLLAEVMGGQRASRDEHWFGRGGLFLLLLLDFR